MTLDEAIKHAEDVAEEQEKLANTYESFKDCGNPKSSITSGHKKCLNCAEEHRQLAEWLKELKQLREQTRWIPVSERLPEDGRPVLIYAWNVHHVIARYDSFRTENGYKKCWVTADAWNGNTEIKRDVIAWMPLPKPYELESEE